MAESTPNASRTIWRAVLTGAAAVPIAVFAAAPAVGSAPTETMNIEQEPTSDQDQAVLDLDACLTELEALAAPPVSEPASLPVEAEQLPAPDAEPGEAPDLVTMLDTCESIVDVLQEPTAAEPEPDAPAPEEPAPAEPEPEAPGPEEPVG